MIDTYIFQGDEKDTPFHVGVAYQLERSFSIDGVHIVYGTYSRTYPSLGEMLKDWKHY